MNKLMVDWAENKAKEHFEQKGSGDSTEVFSPTNLPKNYVNAKKIIKKVSDVDPDLLLPEINAGDDDDKPHKKSPDPSVKYVEFKADNWFGTEVNHNFSSVHVPTSIYDLRGDILDGIQWTSNMDEVFKSNFDQNPTLLWQYYASSSGFMRQYPASKWPNDNSDKHNPDIYDCRTRPWYTVGCQSPKNMVILQDVSGSMTGLRREIAKHANLENVREFKVALDQDRTAGMANFTEALIRAFNILERHRDHSLTGSGWFTKFA
ncbi:Voltage-dependent calcium channel subunit alpha-2/delta-1 [Orchesella cincta]|uniref:Voltage-dependent calcium channel subunit alpha-2/delta-1 n=1 Tax=Orchesella cincta TaxID=48709 RepID=A0A1D2MPF8_ORCCI|nr:Voltage-dependent calcium channel subunit alpha-2/delta-1 [Orchesella cincta]